MRRAGLEPLARVFRIYSAAEVQSAGIRGERGAGGGFIARAEHDDVAARQGVAPVKFRERRGGFFGDEVGAQAVAAERAADDLLHLAFMQVYARTKHGGKVKTKARSSKPKVGVANAYCF